MNPSQKPALRVSAAPAYAPEALRRGLAEAFSEGGNEPAERRASDAKRPTRTSEAREPGERSGASGAPASEPVGESEGRSPSEKT
jgi:hypothetical protein